jgi:S1-C subfamily serine protease
MIPTDIPAMAAAANAFLDAPPAPTGASRRRNFAPGLLAALLILPALHARQADPDPRRDVVVDVVERVMPCVVNIATEEIVEYRDPFADLFREFFGPHYRNRPRSARYSLGSGVIIDEDGYVLTNLHVVQRATKVWVQLHDGREFEAQPIVGTTRRDVALLRLRAPNGEKFRAVRFAGEEDLLLGETVLALGNPFGLGGSVSRGILSSKNRRPPIEDKALDIADWLQTDAAINPGSSGGPLLNLRGELIGLNVAVYREGQGIGFAIPIKQVTEALSTIFTPEVQESLWVGLRIRSGAPPLRIIAVDPGSPADRAGLRVDDLIADINGQTPRSFIHSTLLLSQAGADSRLTVQRGDARKTVTLKPVPLQDLVRQRLGATLQEMDPDLASQFGVFPAQGLLIAEVQKDGPADAAQLRKGYVIATMDGQATPDLLSAAGILGPKAKDDPLELGLLVQQRRGPFTQLAHARATVKLR